MKIKASKVKPGMVIQIGESEICLVTATFGSSEVEYTFLDLQQAYDGLLVATIDGKQKVKVIKGQKREAAIAIIKTEVFKRLDDTTNTIDTIRLIEAMDSPRGK